jgi:UDP-N-acetylglucosamine--N-acetylmuramyl-(pentapeptide) pyrophosphoryl-undecaprenol N-acetylglucosamine transferase
MGEVMTSQRDVLLVCSGGGHLRQLASFVERIGYPRERQVWVTFRNGLSESLLAGREVIYAPFTGPRDGKNFVKLVRLAHRLLREREFSEVISTGSSPAVAFLPGAAARGATVHYIESAARADGPSLTGKIIARFPRINTYCQYPVWADKRWEYRGSVFDEFEPGPEAGSAPAPRRAVISVGTQEGYPFTRMLDAVVPLLKNFDEVLYQTGDLDPSDWGINGRNSVPYDELQQAIARSDVVISHAGVGAALTALRAGKHPILIPRLAAHNEHVDDHQLQVARELERRGLATTRTPDSLTYADVLAASRRSVRTTPPPPFHLRSSKKAHDVQV